MFAHGNDDLREPVRGVVENETSNLSSGCGFGILDGKRNSEMSTVNEKEEKIALDPKWNGLLSWHLLNVLLNVVQ